MFGAVCHRMGSWGMGMGMGRGIGWLGGLVGLLFLAGLALAMVALLVWLWQRSQHQTRTLDSSLTRTSSQALQILSERYARGEITREEFLAMRAELL